LEKNQDEIIAMCSECNDGRLVLAYPERLNGFAWRCNLHPYCEGKAKFCPACREYPLTGGQTICPNPDCIKPALQTKKAPVTIWKSTTKSKQKGRL
jgi:hypothetical protein